MTVENICRCWHAREDHAPDGCRAVPDCDCASFTPKLAIVFVLVIDGSTCLFSEIEALLLHIIRKLGHAFALWSDDKLIDETRMRDAAPLGPTLEIRETPCNHVFANKGRLRGTVTMRRL